jgi:glycosyltransferase involved in cell wall biosynthesis
MYIIYNFASEESTRLQLMSILARHIERPIFFTDLPETVVKTSEGLKSRMIKCRRLFPSIRILRGLTNPLISQYISKGNCLNRGIHVLIFDEMFSSTMIHAVFAKTILKSKVYIYCFENMCQPLYLRILGRFFGRFVDGALCSCKETQKQVEDMGVGNTHVCPYPIRDPRTAEIKRVNQIKRVGFIGRLEKAKGILYLCEAMKRFPDKELYIAGSGSLAREVLGYSVSFLGALHLEAIDVFYSKIDLLVIPSQSTETWSEQYGRVIVEAMARGIIVIGSNSGAIPEIIGNSRLIFRQKSVSAISEKIQEISDIQRSELLEISHDLRVRYIQKYSNTAFFKVISETIQGC